MFGGLILALSRGGQSLDAQKRTLMLADSKIAGNAGWDRERLAQMLFGPFSANYQRQQPRNRGPT